MRFDAGRSQTRHGGVLIAGQVLAVVIVIAAVVVELVRPLAGDLGPPPSPQGWFDAEYLARAGRYHRPLRVTAVLSLAITVAVPVALAWRPAGRRFLERLATVIGTRRPSAAAAATVLVALVLTDLALLPLTWWAGFVHEGAYGLRTQGLGGWFRDWFIARGPVWLGASALAAGGTLLWQRAPPRWWPVLAGLGAAAASAVLILVGPLVLEPLVFETAPLAQGPARAEVERVLAAAGEEFTEVVVADASRRTTRTNAYVSGLGPTRRVVLYDTLVARPPSEIGLVLAHELAHRRHRDVARGALNAAAGSIVTVYAVWVLLRDRPAGAHTAVAALAVILVLGVAGLPLQAWASRRAEAAADLAALDLTGAPGVFEQANLALARTNLAEPEPPGWERLAWYTHPPVMARLEMGRRWPHVAREHWAGAPGPP